jgi:hypothetical protein
MNNWEVGSREGKVERGSGDLEWKVNRMGIIID